MAEERGRKGSGRIRTGKPCRRQVGRPHRGHPSLQPSSPPNTGKGGEGGADASGPANRAGDRWHDRIEDTYPSYQAPPRALPCRPTMVADTHLHEAIGNRVPADEGDQINPQLHPWKLTGDASSRRPPTSESQTRKVPTRQGAAARRSLSPATRTTAVPSQEPAQATGARHRRPASSRPPPRQIRPPP